MKAKHSPEPQFKSHITDQHQARRAWQPFPCGSGRRPC